MGRISNQQSSLFYFVVGLLLCSFHSVSAAEYSPPRMPDGKPSLQGIWTNVSVTDLQRKAGVEKLVLSPEEAAAIEGQDFYNIRIVEDAKPNDPNDNTLLDGSDLRSGGGYNAFWVDPGHHHGVVRGEIRSSWIIDPDDGRIPFSDSGRQLRSAFRQSRNNYDGPDSRPLGERCLIGFGGTGGPPMLNVLYNNHYQIVQNPDYIAILVEMNHDVRIIPIDQQRHPNQTRKWLGDSVGYWEGDTLVVETRSWHPEQGNRGPINFSDDAKVVERFTRYSDEQIYYQFSVVDRNYYSQAWHGEMSFNKTDGPIYEYACHEGNYALPGILQGARAEEAEGRESVVTSDDEG